MEKTITAQHLIQVRFPARFRGAVLSWHDLPEDAVGACAELLLREQRAEQDFNDWLNQKEERVCYDSSAI